ADWHDARVVRYSARSSVGAGDGADCSEPSGYLLVIGCTERVRLELVFRRIVCRISVVVSESGASANRAGRGIAGACSGARQPSGAATMPMLVAAGACTQCG